MSLKLSISLITYNHEAFIGQALDSILSQEVDFDYEIVIGEDFSTDNTQIIVQEYQKKNPQIIKLVARNGNVGSTINFSDTLLHCKGEYIANMDGDDLMLPGKLQKQVEFLDNNKDFVMVAHTQRAFESSTNKTIRVVRPKKLKDHYTIEDIITKGSIFGNSSKMFRAVALPKVPVSPKINLIADLYLTLHVTAESKIGFIDEVLGEYRVHSGGMMRNLRGQEVFEDIQTTFDSIDDRFGEKYQNLYNRRLAYGYLMLGMDNLRQNNLTSARKNLIQSMKKKPFYTRAQIIYLILSYLPMPIRNWFIQIKHTFAS